MNTKVFITILAYFIRINNIKVYQRQVDIIKQINKHTNNDKF